MTIQPTRTGTHARDAGSGQPHPVTMNRTVQLGLGAAVIVLLGLWAAWVLNNARPAGHQDRGVTVEQTFTGTIAMLGGADRDHGCVDPDDGGRTLCSVFASAEGVPVHVGERVQVARETVWTGGGNGYEVFLLYPKTSP